LGIIPDGVILGLGGIFVAGLWLGSKLWRDSGAKKQVKTSWTENFQVALKGMKVNEYNSLNIYSSDVS
jgi:hypothetical protein